MLNDLKWSFFVSLARCMVVDVADSPYFWCTEGETSQYRYDCHKYWRCRSKLWTVQICPGRLMWSVDKKQCVSNAKQCGDRWIPETDGKLTCVN